MAQSASAKSRPESVQRIEPTSFEAVPPELADLATELAAAASALGNALHPRTAASLARLVRIMNAYYSNLIEGQHTRPRDIERALVGDLDADETRRNLQLEAASHVRVQTIVDRLAADGQLREPASEEFIQFLHREFYDGVPESMLFVRSTRPDYRMKPGEWRSNAEDDVVVGRHRPPSSAHVEESMRYFSARFRFAEMGASTKIFAMAIAHHRLNYIHPFPDGNGRVSRLMSHAMAHAAGIGAHGLWSVSRGLARGLDSRNEYKSMMDLADTPREGALDGRGNLSLKALTEFVAWFLRVCLDQVRFMSSLFELNALGFRLRELVEHRYRLRPEAATLVEQLLARGELERARVPIVLGMAERSARRIVSELVELGLVGSATPKGPLSLQFTPTDSELLFPRLFPVT